MKMKIAFLTPEYPHPHLGHSAGIGSSIKNLAVALAAQGHQITVFVYSQNYTTFFIEDEIEIHAIAHQKYLFGGFYFYRKKLQKYINKVIQEKGIQLIEAPDWTGITAFMRFKIPLVIRMNGTDAYFCQLEGRKQKMKNYFFERIALQQADYLLSASHFTAECTKKLFKLKQDIKVIHNFIDTDAFQPIEQEGERMQLLYFGTLIRKKGVLELASIFNKVIEKEPLAKLLLLGNDVIDIQEHKSTLTLFKERLSEAAQHQVQHHSSVPYQQVKKFIASSSVVVLPSLAEAFPMTWLEAMAMEKAIVTSDIGWAKELMVDGKTGFMVNPYQHAIFAERIICLLNDNQLAKEMGFNARQHIMTHFSKLVLTTKNEEFYKDINGV